jgi:hypothetical protein
MRWVDHGACHVVTAARFDGCGRRVPAWHCFVPVAATNGHREQRQPHHPEQEDEREDRPPRDDQEGHEHR